MRFAPFLLVAALSVMASSQANSQPSAIEYPWCAEYGGGRGGGGNCGFVTLEQCRAALSGNGGYCRENLFFRRFVADYGLPGPRPDRPVRPYR